MKLIQIPAPNTSMWSLHDKLSTKKNQQYDVPHAKIIDTIWHTHERESK